MAPKKGPECWTGDRCNTKAARIAKAKQEPRGTVLARSGPRVVGGTCLLMLAACGRAPGLSEVHAASSSAVSVDAGAFDPLATSFADVTEKFFTGQIQVADLVRLAEPALLLSQRGEPISRPNRVGWVVQELTFAEHSALSGQLAVLPVTAEGHREFQIDLRGPVTSGVFRDHALYRDLTISFAFDAEGEPLFCLGLLQDRIARTVDAFMSYQGKVAAQSGAVYTIGREDAGFESYWQPILLEAEIEDPSTVDPHVADAAEHQPGLVFTWRGTRGKRGERFGELGHIASMYELLH